MSPSTGRKPSDNPKGTMLRVRLDKDTVEMLEDCASELHTTKSEVVRIGIRKVKESIKK